MAVAGLLLIGELLDDPTELSPFSSLYISLLLAVGMGMPTGVKVAVDVEGVMRMGRLSWLSQGCCSIEARLARFLASTCRQW